MGRRRTKYEVKPWENGGSSNRKFVATYVSMMASPNYKRLSLSSQAVYTALKAFYTGCGDTVTASNRQICSMIGTTGKTVTKALKELEEGGFIDVVHHGGLTGGRKNCNVYRFSCRWATKIE